MVRSRMEKTFEEVMTRFREISFNEDFDLVVAIASGGIIPAAIINQRLQKEFQMLQINLRDEYQQPRYDSPRLLAPLDFDCRGKHVLLVEDRIKTGATVQFAKELLTENGAAAVRTFAVNGDADYALYNEACFRFPWIV